MTTTLRGRYCRRCDYDLSASLGQVCPECGRPFSKDDPRSVRTYRKRSWQGRWRRGRWLLVPAALLAVVWPRGWVVTRMMWVDPAGGASVESTALVIGHPWWIKGWFGPLTWSSTAGGPSNPPPAHVTMVDSLWKSDGALLWKSVSHGQGRLSVVGVSPLRAIKQPEWNRLIADYVGQCASESGTASANSDGMSISAPVPPWTDFMLRRR
jgi:hypothetical protein